METCVGCGSPLAPTWKFCVYCGIAVEPRAVIVVPQIPAAIRPANTAVASNRARNRLLLLGGIGIFLVGVALLVIAVAMFTGAFR